MTIKEKIKSINSNALSKTLLTSVVSILITLAFAVYNVYLSVKFQYAFSIAISIYYFLTIFIKFVTLIIEKCLSKKDEGLKQKVRHINYFVASLLVFVMDFCLIAPTILMVTDPQDFAFGLIPAIVYATYAVYKITISIINYTKSKSTNNLSIILFREINIIEAILSILILQHVLIMANGGMNASMRTLSFVTSIGFIGMIVVFSILSFMRNRNQAK